MNSDPFKTLRTPPPNVSLDLALNLLREQYGITAHLRPLDSERDQNFQVSTAAGSKFVLKFSNTSEAKSITDFQNRGLEHIARVASKFEVPRVVSTRNDELMFGIESESGRSHCVRLLSWVDGVPLQEASGVKNIAVQMGNCLATLAIALRDFKHPASDYLLLWDIRNATFLNELLPYVDDVALRATCEAQLARFYDVIKPKLDALPRQVIYNDMNPSNVLVSRENVNRLTGVIDFGDMVYSQRINDVAIASAYLCKIEDDPFEMVLDFLAAYTDVLPLADEEISVLPDLILTRHLMTLMISHWRTSLFPENRAYIKRSEARARQMLVRVASRTADETVSRFYDVCLTDDRHGAVR